MESQKQAIQLEGLTKDFPLAERGRYLRAVDKLTLSIAENSVYGLLGPNGSGKSTTIRMLLGLSRPSCGSAKIFGESPELGTARARIGYLPDAPYYHSFLSGLELMHFFGRLLGVEKRILKTRSVALLEQFGLADAMNRKLGSYSKGMLQRLGFAQALVGDPDVLVLDEPTAGVDPVGAAEVGEFVRELKAQGKTVLLCSHLLTQVQDLCDHVGILNKGKLLAHGSLDSLLGQADVGGLAIRGLDPAARAEVEGLARERGGQVLAGQTDLEELFRKLVLEDERKGVEE